MFKPNNENKEIMEFTSKNANAYMNETADNCLVITPIGLRPFIITYKDLEGKTIKVYAQGLFIEDAPKI